MNNQIELTEQDLNQLSTELEKTPTKDFFKEVISNLPEEKVKKEIPNLEKASKSDRIEPILTANDQEKIAVYEKLEVKDLPSDWKLKLARLKELEKNQADYLIKKEELKGWTDTFGSEIKPQEVERKIEEMEAENEKREKKLEEKVSELEKDLEKSISESKQALFNFGEKVKELESKLEGWNNFFAGKELEEVRSEWEELKKRPDISISENEFYDDYCRRKSLRQSELEGEELEREREKFSELQKKIKSLLSVVNNFLKTARTRKYIMAKPIINVVDAEEAIVELLEETEKTWESYFQGEEVDSNLPLELEVYPEKKERVKQVLEWIKEAKENKDYQKLYEKWNEGKGYKEENNFDGSLSLLKKYLEIEEEEPAL